MTRTTAPRVTSNPEYFLAFIGRMMKSVPL
jgi:hypothetical protein